MREIVNGTEVDVYADSCYASFRKTCDEYTTRTGLHPRYCVASDEVVNGLVRWALTRKILKPKSKKHDLTANLMIDSVRVYKTSQGFHVPAPTRGQELEFREP